MSIIPLDIVYVDASGKGRVAYYNETRNKTEIFQFNTMSPPEAEYMAIILALLNNQKDLDIYSDSQLVVNQLNHKWNIKNKKLRNLANSIWKMSDNRIVNFNWMPREKNKAGKVLG